MRLLPLERCKTQGGFSHKTDAERKFVTAPYVEDDDGNLNAVVPGHCACGADGQPCRIWRHAYRDRQQGPGHRLLVLRCTTHGIYFTLYPPGWTPWGRTPVVAKSVEGSLFGAASQATQGVLWPRHGSRGQSCEGLVARAQSRHIGRAARWLGLCAGEAIGDAICEALGLESLDAHRNARQAWATLSTRELRGQLVMQVFDALEKDDRFIERLLRAGTATQHFDVVYIVDQDGGLRRLPTLGRMAKPAP